MTDKNYRLWKTVTGIVVTLIAGFTYLSTIEPSASFWDCGEFIASSYKLEVGHPPGNPVFQLIARFFTMFTDGSHAAIAVNGNPEMLAGRRKCLLDSLLRLLVSEIRIGRINHSETLLPIVLSHIDA